MPEEQVDPEIARTLAIAGELRARIGQLTRRLREEAQPGDFTTSQKSVLGRLEREGPATLSALARAEGMRPQSMGAIVSVLEVAGLLAGTPDPSDGRQTILSLTAAARERINADRAAREDWLFRAIRAKLEPDEQEQLANGITLLTRLLDP
jgi:DNA-binding MarR family transcriptional regulator